MREIAFSVSHNFFSIIPEQDGGFSNQLVFKENQVNGDKRGRWDGVKALTDPKNPTKKYLEFSAFAGNIAADSFTTDSRATVIMIADK